MEPGFAQPIGANPDGQPGPLYTPRVVGARPTKSLVRSPTLVETARRSHDTSGQSLPVYPPRVVGGHPSTHAQPVYADRYGLEHEADDQEVYQSRSFSRSLLRAIYIGGAVAITSALSVFGYTKMKQVDAPQKIESPSGTESGGFTMVRRMIDQLSIPSNIKLPWILDAKKQAGVADSILHPQPEVKGPSTNSPDVAIFADGIVQIQLKGSTRAEEIGVGGRQFIVAYSARTQLPKFYAQGLLQRVSVESNYQEIKWRLEFKEPVQMKRMPDGTITFFTTIAAATEQARVQNDMRLDESAGTIAAGQYRLVRAGGVKLRTIANGVATLDGGSLQRGNTFELTGKIVQVGDAWFVEVAGSKKYIPLRDERGTFTVELMAAKATPNISKSAVEVGPQIIDLDGIPVGKRHKYIEAAAPAPYDLIEIAGEHNGGKKDTFKLRAATRSAFVVMQQEAARQGITLNVAEGYRSYTDQKGEHEKSHEDGQEKAEEPGYSEHHLGTTIDITGVARDPEKFLWLLQHAFRHGFVPTYYFRIGESRIIKESWHWRYVGPDAAQKFATFYAVHIQKAIREIEAAQVAVR